MQLFEKKIVTFDAIKSEYKSIMSVKMITIDPLIKDDGVNGGD